MAIEVYTTTKPASSYRAWVASAGLLLLATVLAGWMSGRGPVDMLEERIEPQGWDISFRPPAPFEPVDPDPGLFSTTYRYALRAGRGTRAEITIWRVRTEPDRTVEQICENIISRSGSWMELALAPPPTILEATVGGRGAVEVREPAIQMVVRATMLGDGCAYAVSLRTFGAAIDEPLYGLYAMVCDSVEFNAR